ncbi:MULTISPECIES: excinuclease ABC subunit UvrA [Clostridium]|uniref:excinuclease ABC subunit UvrA n=1 Tax=Clostridium TaxID=1485 RepID=UPI0008253272|nr:MULTISPECIES: excinuclease ABC subunit UvrA [Clostridium]PJI06509.1 excinuclease ABC subunit A [Clostridium sp. CT7]
MKDYIWVEGAREHNLKNISLKIPKNKLIVLTGLSGSGKSSLAFDTLQKECQRQYMESLGMITENINKPNVRLIKGLSPSISVNQRVLNCSPRSTVGTVTEIFTYLRVLYARFGERYCSNCGEKITPSFNQSGEDYNDSDNNGDGLEKKFILCPNCKNKIFELGMSNFSFNKPEGACPKCMGLGKISKVNMKTLLNEELSVLDGAVSIWCSAEIKRFSSTLVNAGKYFGFPFDPSIPVKDYNNIQKNLLLYGIYDIRFKKNFPNIDFPKSVDNGRFDGIVNIVLRRYEERGDDINYRKKISKLIIEDVCPDCKGSRLRKESREVILGDKSITEVSKMSLYELMDWINELPNKVIPKCRLIIEQTLSNLRERVRRLIDVGLGYLTMGRASLTLSAGEYQRLRLASLLGSGLTGVLYVLDEPTTGLHQRDTDRLIKVLKQLRDLGNTVMVIEHDTEMMKAADYIIDIGPGAGKKGGNVIIAGTLNDVLNCNESITGRFLSGKELIEIPKKRLLGNGKFIRIKGARENNLKNINVNIPLGVFVAITGVSGSGKSTLMFDILAKFAQNSSSQIGNKCDSITGLEYIDKVITINQTAIGRTPRSNAATYTEVFNLIRDLFSKLEYSRKNNLKPKHFSFNVSGGRCEKCQGAGVLMIPMHFLPDEQVLCPECHGKRFQKKILGAKYKDKTISDVLNMTIDEAILLFENENKIKTKLLLMKKVGIGYLQLGQPATTLSGGEAQRIKLAKELGKSSKGHTLYIIDEPTTGLHPQDVKQLILVLQKLVSNNNTVIVIEHNLEVIKVADWIIDLGPEGGDKGGEIVAEGTPEEIMHSPKSITGMCLRKKIF